mmetsp:Transcript_31757/g.69403  ORF Transcript_31757/g.69403 Transcript_31757/m.69403 type:complete len:263 (-) Transcript_31757:125-913(-)
MGLDRPSNTGCPPVGLHSLCPPKGPCPVPPGLIPASDTAAAELASRIEFDLESVCSDASSTTEDPTEVVVGPTSRATSAVPINSLSLAQVDGSGRRHYFPIKSGPRCTCLGDVMRLSFARSPSAPLSFGSVLHLNFGTLQPCRPCMFEKQRSGRCRRSWLCDFCHLHARESYTSALNIDLGSFLAGRAPNKSSTTVRGQVSSKMPQFVTPEHNIWKTTKGDMAFGMSSYAGSSRSCSGTNCCLTPSEESWRSQLQHGACFSL